MHVIALALQAPAQTSDDALRFPGHLLAVDVPDPAVLDFSGSSPAAREQYRAAREKAQDV